MKNILIILVFIFTGCSFKTPPNKAQFETTNAFASYTKNFLSDNDAIAKNDINRAISHAKKSANLDALARIYLGECALNISVDIQDSCKKYRDVKELVLDDSLQAYYSFITLQIKKAQIDKLPKMYRAFASHLYMKKFNKAYEEILKMDSEVSQLLSASLIKNQIDKNQIGKIIDIASFYGYKKSVLFWLSQLQNITKDKVSNKMILKKIKILKSK